MSEEGYDDRLAAIQQSEVAGAAGSSAESADISRVVTR